MYLMKRGVNLLLKASRKAVQVPFDDDEDQVDGERADNVNEAYRRLMDLAIQERKQGKQSRRRSLES
jgi:hypothetical protein